MGEPSRALETSRTKVSCKDCTLGDLCLPHGLDSTEVEHLDRVVLRHRLLARGEHVFRAGDGCLSLYAVRSGSIKSYVSTQNGSEQILDFHLPGELLALDGLENERHTCSALAMEATHICELPVFQLEKMCQLLPGLPRQLLRLIGREVATDHAMLLLLGKKSAMERLATFLFTLCARFKQRGFSEREFNLSMPRDDIANYLGLARETVSRLFTRFQEEGLLTVQRRNIRIHDLNRLQALANPGTSD
jgi:CRP/FNR family transcriptional regulator